MANEYSPPLFLIDFGLNVVALLLSITIYSNYAASFSLLLALNAFILYMGQTNVNQTRPRKPPPKPEAEKPDAEFLDVLYDY